MPKWDFDVERSGCVENWRWRKTDWDLSTQSSVNAFSSFDECFSDAAKHGCDSEALVVVNTYSGNENRKRRLTQPPA